MRTKKNQLRVLILSITAIFISLQMNAQVTIGSQVNPNPNALLDLKEIVADSTSTRGLLLPRVKLTSTTSASPLAEHVKGMFVYNIATTTGTNNVTPGIYYNDGTKWVRTDGSGGGEKWFYMPSFNLPVTAKGTGLTFDLYGEYKTQFAKDVPDKQFVSSNTSATAAQPVYAANQLEYYVIAYQTDCLKINSISAQGVMNYDVISTDIPVGSFINVIFVVK